MSFVIGSCKHALVTIRCSVQDRSKSN